MTEAERTPQNEAYQRLKDSIRQTYPQDWFVAIADKRVLAASADFRELKVLVRAEGFDPRNVLIVEAGVTYPEFVDIFSAVLEQ
jgi:hypothetical protein